MTGPDLDAWLPEAQIRTRHRRTAAADQDALWAAARGVRLRETRALGRLVSWRIPGVAADGTYTELFSTYPFTVLAEGERSLLAGMAGRIWTLRRDYPELAGPEAYRAWAQPGTVRVLFGHWTESDGDGRSALVSEARVQAVDRVSGLRLKSLWVLVGRFERLIGAEPLVLAARRAEAGSG